MHHQKNLIYLIRGLGFQKRMRNYLYKGNSARIYMLFKFYQTAIKRNKPLKSEMIHSINTSYLKRFLPLSKTGEISNNIRSQITRKYKVDDIHQMLYGFLKLKLEERFKLYLEERGEKSYDDLTLLSAQLNLGTV